MLRVFCLVPLLALVAFGGLAESAPCESLQSLTLAETTILSATVLPGGPFTLPARANAPPGATPKPVVLPVRCRVVARISPAINFEVWMPESNWNGKFQAVGGGGFAGVISYGAMTTALNRGYATASTDTGHSTPGGSWALGHPELIVDFAHRAVHEVTVKSKAIVEAFYGNAPRRSYFEGCSTGGRQALMEAQRYPGDYDGIVAGAPANFWTGLMTNSVAVKGAILKDPASHLSPAKFALLNKAAVAACDLRDGVRDGLIENPAQCPFDPKVLQCSGANTDECLTAPQVEAARRIYGSTINPRTKAEVFPGLTRGSELWWDVVAGGPEPGPITLDFFKYFVHSDQNWDWRTFDIDKDGTAADTKFASLMNAGPDLNAFAARGGKLIMYHGWNDDRISPFNTINYVNHVKKAIRAAPTDDFLRLFMAPGMLHCAAAAPGPNAFDAVGALDQWVEKAVKPDRLIASHSTNGVVDRTRPLCPYPQVATYTGSGSIDDAASFVCK